MSRWHQFEMISPGRTSSAVAYCRGAENSSLVRSPDSLNDPEHGLTRSQAGQPALGHYASIHVHGGHGHRIHCGHLFRDRSCDAILDLLKTDHGFGSSRRRGLFCLKHGSRRAEITCAQSPFHGFSERNECHLKFPLRASSNALRIARKRGQGRAKDQQELVNLGQGGGRCD